MSFPDTAKETIANVMREVGIANLSIKVLRQRLEAKYGQDFTAHKQAIQETVDSLMATKEFQKELSKVKKQKDEGVVKGGKKKVKAAEEGASPKVRKEKAAKGEKPAKKAEKPDDYPKAALTAYFLFANDRRAELKVSDPTLKVTEIGKRIGEMWKEASEEQKKVYGEKAVADKARFEREMEAYKAKGGETFKRGRSGKDKKSSKKARTEKDPNAPKRPLSAYFYYIADNRQTVKDKFPDLKITEQTAKLGDMWKNLDEAGKAKYEALATADKARYVSECAARGVQVKESTGKTKKPKAAAASSSSDSSSDSSDSSDSDSSSSDSDSSSSDSD